MSIDLINQVFVTGAKCLVLSLVMIVLVSRSRNSSAKLLHGVLVLSLFCIFMLPLISVYAPSVQVPVLPQGFAPFLLVPVTMNDGIGRLILLFAGVWLTVSLLLLSRLVGYVWQAYRLAYRGEAISTGRVVELVLTLRQSLGIHRQVYLFCSKETATPMTLGSVSPLIVLPPEYVLWSEPRLRRFLLHELAHVQRFDWLQKIGGQAIVALLWFLPTAWLLLSRAQWYAELACDDVVVAKEGDRHGYAHDLLALGESLTKPTRGGMALLDGSTHYQRVDALLDSSRVRMGPGLNWWLYAAAIVLLPLGLATVKLSVKIPLFADTRPGFTVVSLAADKLSAQPDCGERCITFTERPSRRWLQPSAQPKPERYSRSPSVAGSPVPGVIDIAPEQIHLEPPIAVEHPIKLVRLVSVEPKYPRRALRQNMEGRVRVRFDVFADGTTGNVEVIQRGSTAMFDSAVIAAVQEFRYRPFSSREAIATASVTETFNFRIVEGAKTRAD